MTKIEVLKKNGFFKDISGNFWTKSNDNEGDLAKREKTKKIIINQTIDDLSVGKLNKLLKKL